MLGAMSRHLEQLAGSIGSSAIVLSAFQEAGKLNARVRNRYRLLAGSATLVAALGAGVGAQPAVGVVGADLADDDVLRQEWAVVVLAPTYAAALVGRDLGDDPAVTPARERLQLRPDPRPRPRRRGHHPLAARLG